MANHARPILSCVPTWHNKGEGTIRVGPTTILKDIARPDKTWAALARSNNTIIFLNCNLSGTINKFTERVFSIIQ